MPATIFEAASPAPSATFKAWYMAVANGEFKMIRVDIAHSAEQLTLTVSHARYYVGPATVSTANIDDIFGSAHIQSNIATSNSGAGYGAASVTYQIAY